MAMTGGAWYDATYGGVKQKWLLVKSEQASKRERHTLNKTILKNTQQAMKAFKKLGQQSFACETDALNALEKWEKAQTYIRVAEKTILKTIGYETAGRPKADAVGTAQYQIYGQLVTCKQRQSRILLPYSSAVPAVNFAKICTRLFCSL